MNIQSGADVSRILESGQLWAQDEGEALLRVVEFASLPVPDDGLRVRPPCGGTLTVWPDGSYEFVPASEDSRGSEQPISTYYGYVAEDLYGEAVTGTFVLARAEDSPDSMHDFQAWSLPEMLDNAAALLLEDAPGGAGDSGYDADLATRLDSLDPALDDLARLILDSHHM